MMKLMKTKPIILNLTTWVGLLTSSVVNPHMDQHITDVRIETNVAVRAHRDISQPLTFSADVLEASAVTTSIE
jgi:hypothetical protein